MGHLVKTEDDALTISGSHHDWWKALFTVLLCSLRISSH